MKTKLLLPLIISICLSGCNSSNKQVKYILEKKEEGSLTLITPKQMFEIGCLNMKDSIFLLSINTCTSCIEASEQVSKFALMNKCEIYKIEFSQVTYDQSETSEEKPETDYSWLYKATTYSGGDDDYYALPKYSSDITLPRLYFYKFGGVGYMTQSDFITQLKNKVEVK